MNNQTMNLEELMMNEGQFMSVANVKKGSIEDRIVTTKEPLKVKVLAEKVEKIKWDLRAVSKDGVTKFEFSEAFFNSISRLDEAGVGFSEFYIPSLNKTVLILCEEDVDNKFKVTPKFLNTKKGAKKSLLFKGQSFEFYAQKSEYIKKNENNTWLFNLTEEMPSVYGLTPAEVVVEVKADDMVVDNSPVITSIPGTSSTSVLNNVEMTTVTNVEEIDGLSLGQIPFTPEEVVTVQETAINSFEAQTPVYNPSYMADQLDSFAESLASN